MTIRRGLATAAVVLSVAAFGGCAGGEGSASVTLASPPTSEPSPAAEGQQVSSFTRVVPKKMAAPDPGVVATFHERFMAARNAVVVGDADATSLEDLAMPAPIERARAASADNEVLLANDDPSARSDVYSFSRPLDIEALNDDHFAFTSCTEEQTWHSASDDWSVRFVDEKVTVWDSPTGWKVASVEVRHDGSDEAGGLTCAPPTFAERADAAAHAGIGEAHRALAKPANAAPNGLWSDIGGRLEEEMNLIVAQQLADGYERSSAQDYQLTVLGVDPEQPDHVVVVSMCSIYPDGVTNRAIETGEETPVEAYPPGHREENWLYVWLEPVKHGDAWLVAIEPAKHDGCKEQR